MKQVYIYLNLLFDITIVMTLHRQYKSKNEVYIKYLFMIKFFLKTGCYDYIYLFL